MISTTTVSEKQPYGITVIIIKWRSASVWWFGGLKVSAFIGTYACRSNSLFSNMLFGEREREREGEREKERREKEQNDFHDNCVRKAAVWDNCHYYQVAFGFCLAVWRTKS